MPHWSDPPFDPEDAQSLLFAIHDVPFVVRSNDAAVITHVARAVERYRTGESRAVTGTQLVLNAVQGVPTFDPRGLKDLPRRSNPNKPARIATADSDGARIIFRRDTEVLTAIEPDAWTLTGDLRAHPGEVIRALDAMLSLALIERGWITLKGSALARDGGGVALIGGPDSARRALAVTLVSRGFRWVTEDLLLVRVAAGHVEMRGLPGLLRLGPAAMIAHPALRATLSDDEQEQYEGQSWRNLREVDARYVVDAVDAFGTEGIAGGGTLTMIVALRWKGSEAAGTPTVMPLARPDAYEVLADAMRSFDVYMPEGAVPTNIHRLRRIAETVAMRVVTGPVDLATPADEIAVDDAATASDDLTATVNGMH